LRLNIFKNIFCREGRKVRKLKTNIFDVIVTLSMVKNFHHYYVISFLNARMIVLDLKEYKNRFSLRALRPSRRNYLDFSGSPE